MSHFQLGNKDEANKYREQLTEAMKLDAFKDDEDCQNFVQEVDILFEGSPIETQPGKNVGADSNPAP